ncbi:site-specific integrase [Actinoplanes sp. NPDC049118]|uniref:tyrosine-type recombinase/integrase n=1 Tax=Actinoplanes sp. NPDC049118 TaxID=3155769 RepID=UPI0033C5DA1A
MPRRRYPTISEGDDGKWHAWVSVTRPDGTTRQRHVKRATEAEVETVVDELLEQKRAGAAVERGRPPTVEQWMTTYLDTIAPRRCDPGTIRDYRSLCVHWFFPVAGGQRLGKLLPGHLDEVYLKMTHAGKAQSTQLKMHRVINRALEVAYRRGLVPRNVAQMIDPPTAEAVEQTALTQPAAESVLAVTGDRRNGTRWAVGLALGLRQGEALGLRWSYLDLERGEMRVWWQLRRRAFEHGCGDSPCGRVRGGNCPQRHLSLKTGETAVLDLSKPATADRRTGLVFKTPKGKSKRTVPMPDQLVELLRRHQIAQDIERIVAEEVWQDHDLVFSRPDGQPIDPKHDHQEWKALLALAGVPATRLHDGRHTAASILILLGVPIEVVQEILGHSDVRVTRRYVHVASELARLATQRMGSALLKIPPTPSRTP